MAPAPPLGGLSIGLSPLSPGFAIVPKRRTGAFRALVQRASMRRTVSESDAHVRHENGENEDGLHARESNGHETSAETSPGDYAERIRARSRWKWLRQVIFGQ